MVFNASKSAIFPLPTSKDAGLNKSVPKQMLQRVLLNIVKKHCLSTVSSMRKYQQKYIIIYESNTNIKWKIYS